jgi:NAD(P)-dependent dehydrogenase (short-subunit alcohol dehydrogenase family)
MAVRTINNKGKSMDLKLAGASVVVTGGTRGIGREIVRTFIAEGAKVAFCARDAAMVEAYVLSCIEK